ncbi:MAG: ubiquinone/menaquinone biosynthesis methyltransferase [Bacteroidetes bacterium]|nr:ubiquinone/menaquinone biosynthesis methyltransferase [Bacteroidota bacterium]
MKDSRAFQQDKRNPGEGRPLYRMFNSIPRRYDFMNRLLTLRFDEIWRKKATRFCLQDDPGAVMDLCTGTGDLAVRLAGKANKHTKITALDFSENMLEIAAEKAKNKKFGDRIEFVHGDASEMPFLDESFDSIGIAFAFRNLTFKNPLGEKAVAEVYRVLRNGGRFVITESSQPRNPLMIWVFRNYLKLVVDKFGGKLSGHQSAYHYLAHSALNYYHPKEVEQLLKNVGFSNVKSIPLMGGIAAIHVATK